jgi:hypothetical protein
MQLLRAVILSIALAGTSRIPVAAGAPQAPPASPESPVFSAFTQRAQEYIKLQKSVPRLRTTKHREEIIDRRRGLAQKIRETRPNAKPGDIFTADVSEEFRRVIRSAFQGPNAPNVRRTIRQGEPVQGWHLTVNGDYPEHLPLTTVPPTLLLRLPELPSGLAYRIIGHDFVLEDTEARLIVDFIPGIIP